MDPTLWPVVPPLRNFCHPNQIILSRFIIYECLKNKWCYTLLKIEYSMIWYHHNCDDDFAWQKTKHLVVVFPEDSTESGLQIKGANWSSSIFIDLSVLPEGYAVRSNLLLEVTFLFLGKTILSHPRSSKNKTKGLKLHRHLHAELNIETSMYIP